MRLDEMYYTEIEMEGMKEILRDKDKENKRLVKNLAEYKNEITDLKEENKKLKAELDKANELLSNVGRCSEQYREKMVSIMEELKNFLYKD